MSMPTTHLTEQQLDALLSDHHPLQPPVDFTTQVMQAITTQTGASPEVPAQTQDSWWQWLALLLAGIPGIAQVLTLIFSVWHVTAAG